MFSRRLLLWLMLVLLLAGSLWPADRVLLASWPYLVRLFASTWLLAIQVAAVALPAGLFWAWCLLRMKLPARRLILLVLVLQLFLPLYVQAAAWEAGFGRVGWYTVGASELDRPPLSGWTAAVWVHSLAAIPWVTLILGVGLLAADRSSEEAALLDAPAPRMLASLIFPWLAPWLMMALLWVAVTVTTEMTVADLYQVNTFPREIYTGFSLGWTLDEVTHRSLPGLLATFVLALICLSAMLGNSPEGVASLQWRVRRYHAGGWRWPLNLVLLTGGLLLLVVPLGNLVWHAGRVLPADGPAWSPVQMARTLATGLDEFRGEWYWTALIGGASVLMVLPAAILLAALLGRRWARPLVLVVLAVLLAIPGPLWGLGWISLVDRSPLDTLAWVSRNTILAPVVAAAVRSLTWCTLLLWFAVSAIPKEQFEWARLEGLSVWQRWRYITVPQALPSLVIGMLVVLALSTGELAATILVTPPAVTTVAIRLFGLIHAGVRDKEAALALLQVAWCGGVALLLLAAAGWWQRDVESAAESRAA